MPKTTVRSEQITDATITDVDVAAANKDGADATPSMRTLGTGAGQAAKGSTTAPLVSPALTGIPTAPTASPGTNTTQIATTAFVTTAVGGGGNATTLDGIDSSGFAILAGQSGGQLLIGGTNAGNGLALSPNTAAQAANTQVSIQSDGTLTVIMGGTPKASIGNSTNLYGQLVSNPTTGAPIIANSSAVCTGLNADLLDGQHASAFALAGSGVPINNPTFTGIAAAPQFQSTVSTGTPPLIVASTTVVPNLNADMLDGQHAAAFATIAGLSGYAPLASPTFTGIPAAPTAAVSNNSTQLATTAYVSAQIANDAVIKGGVAGGQIIYGGTGTGQSLAILPNTVNSPMDGCLVLYGAIAWGNVITSALLTADQNDYTQSGINGCSVLRLRMDAARTITGIDSKSSNPSYRNMIVMNVGTFDITLANNSASSTVNNRFKFSNSYSKVLKPGGSIWLMQDNNDMGWHEIGLPAQFVYAEGMAGGQLVSGGTAASENLTLQSTSHSTKGEVRITDKLVASNQVAHSGHISATGLLGALNDWAPTGIATASYIYLTTNGSTTLTGIAGGTAGRILTLYHGGSTPLYLAGNDAGSIAANRLSLTSQSLHTGDSITFEYEAINSRWRILSTGNKSVLTQGAQGGQTIYGGINAGENLTLRGSTTTPGGVGIANGMALITGTATGTLSGPLHDFNPTNVPWGILTLNPSGSDLVITGLVKPSGMNLNNYVMILVNGSDFNITLPCESGFSAAANRWYTPGIVDYIIPARGAVQVLYDNTVSRWRILSSQSAPAVSETPWPPLYRTGIRWYRDGTDFVNDVVIQPGKARDDADTVNMELTTQVTKRLDAAWAFGDMQGGLDTGARAANTWYYMWLIKRVDTGVTDILFSTSNSAPTMPANYTKKRLIGEFKTNATNIQPTYVGEIGGGAFYIQMLDLPSQGLDVNVTNCTTSQTTRALPSLPQLGTPIQVDLNVFIQHASIITIVFIGNTALYSGIPSVTVSPLGSIRTTTATVGNNANVRTSTDINSQISDYSLNSATTLRIQVLGYVRPNVM